MYNTMTKKMEALVPANPEQILFYSCGPTVYDDAHIGNFRSFLAADLLRRWIESPLCALKNPDNSLHTSSRTVVQVMNITDVGHMTDDENADGAGQDKMEVAAERILEAKKLGKIPVDAKVDPQDPFAIARYYEARFKQDAITLGLKVAIEAENDRSLMPRATENIDNMKIVIEQLLADGYAYPAGESGSRAVYFDVQRFEQYGQLSGNSIENLKGGAGGRTDEANTKQKNHPADFLLWKEDATHKMKWDSPKIPNLADDQQWGQGYPGWHIECTAMALAKLATGGLAGARKNNAQIDIHSGGEDNIFPHHECEIAQSCCFTGQADTDNPSFARHWFHPRFLKVEGQKMSKSKGTMYTLGDLTAKGIDPAAIRLELIKTHYRANADFSMQGLESSAKRINNWRRMAKHLQHAMDNDKGAFDHPNLNNAEAVVLESLSNDLNIAPCLGILDKGVKFSKGSHPVDPDTNIPVEYSEYIKGIYNTTILPEEPWDHQRIREVKKSNHPCEKQLATLHLIDNILGVIFRPIPKAQETTIALYQPGVTPSPEIESLLIARRDAKASKDWPAADAIRDQLKAMGLSIMDKPEGQVEVAPIN